MLQKMAVPLRPITAFSIGGEMQFGDAMSLGASLTQRNGSVSWDNNFVATVADTTTTELGLKLTVGF